MLHKGVEEQRTNASGTKFNTTQQHEGLLLGRGMNPAAGITAGGIPD